MFIVLVNTVSHVCVINQRANNSIHLFACWKTIAGNVSNITADDTSLIILSVDGMSVNSIGVAWLRCYSSVIQLHLAVVFTVCKGIT